MLTVLMKKPKRPSAVGIKSFFKLTFIVFINIVRLPFFIIFWAGWCFIAFFDLIVAFIKFRLSKIKWRRGREQISASTEEKITGGTK